MNYLDKSESAERRDERNRLLTELYCEIYDNLKQSRVKNLRRVALSIALATGNPRYHVGFDRAYVVVPKLLSGKDIAFKSSFLRDMWLDITQKVRLLMQDGKLSIAQAIPIVLEQCRASRFFLSECHAWVIIKRELKKMHCRRPYGRAA
ncbi:MAG: hypothetical protein IKX63_02025 [Muribaculaceae bacterium]|nr:hypothetical protein [Muribaculaceae bacterium]